VELLFATAEVKATVDVKAVADAVAITEPQIVVIS
jgi:hypothetical protein